MLKWKSSKYNRLKHVFFLTIFLSRASLNAFYYVKLCHSSNEKSAFLTIGKIVNFFPWFKICFSYVMKLILRRVFSFENSLHFLSLSFSKKPLELRQKMVEHWIDNMLNLLKFELRDIIYSVNWLNTSSNCKNIIFFFKYNNILSRNRNFANK